MVSNNKTKIIIAGYFGAGNIGDEAILYAAVKNLNSKFDISVMTIGDFRFDEFSESIQYMELPNFSKIGNIKNFLSSVRRCEGFLLGGGGFLANKLQPRSIYYWMALVLAAKLLRKKVIIFGAGCGPFSDGPSRIPIRYMFENVDLINVRDSISEQHLRDLGVKRPIQISADLAFLIEMNSFGTKKYASELLRDFPHPYILFILPRRFHLSKIWDPNIFSEKYKKYVNAVSNLADYVSETLKGTPIFFPFCKEDLILYRGIRSAMRLSEKTLMIENLPNEKIDFASVFSFFNIADLVIAGRYHGFIFSVLSSTPAVPLVYHPKFYDVVCRADLLGVTVEIGDGIEWPDIDLDLTKLKEYINMVLADKLSYRMKMQRFKEDMKTTAVRGVLNLEKVFLK